MDATHSVDEVFLDVCAIFGDLPKLEKKRRKKGRPFLYKSKKKSEETYLSLYVQAKGGLH